VGGTGSKWNHLTKKKIPKKESLNSLWARSQFVYNAAKYNNGRQYTTSDTVSFCALRGDNTPIDGMHNSSTLSRENQLKP